MELIHQSHKKKTYEKNYITSLSFYKNTFKFVTEEQIRLSCRHRSLFNFFGCEFASKLQILLLLDQILLNLTNLTIYGVYSLTFTLLHVSLNVFFHKFAIYQQRHISIN